MSARYPLIDEMNQPALALDADCRPLFLTAAAARLLRIEDRSSLEHHGALLEPLVALGKRAKLPRLIPGGPAQELSIASTDGVPVPVYAALYETSPGSVEEVSAVVLFWDLRPFHPWFTLVQQSQRVRPALVYASSILGGPLSEQSVEGFARAGLGIGSDESCDLLEALTAAVELADTLVAPTFKMALDVSTSALLSVSRPTVLRLITHLLLEAFDYAGPLGRARVGVSVRRETAQLLVLGSRTDSAAAGYGPLELYLSRKAITSDYRVRSAEASAPIDPDERAFIERNIGGVLSLEFDLIRSLPEEIYSENLRIARHVADRAGAALEAKVDPPRHLFLSAYLPLKTTLQSTPLRR